jgi:adenine-specific DNA-methyltransferase
MQEMTDQPERLDLPSQDIADEKWQKILRLFPDIWTEGGKIDFERLKPALGEAVNNLTMTNSLQGGT